MDPGEELTPPAEPAAPPRPRAPGDAEANTVFDEIVERARAAGLVIQCRETAATLMRPVAQRVLGVRRSGLQCGGLDEHTQ